MPYFSIIIPTYNRAHMLSTAIESIIAQTFGDWELIIIDDGSIELWLWGIDTNGSRVLVIDKEVIGYFYAVVMEGFDPSKIATEIMNSYESSIVTVLIVERRFFGKPVQAIKVYCKVATETMKLAKQLRSFEGVKECLEDDIRVAMRYLIDNDVAPCAWHEVEAEEEVGMMGLGYVQIKEVNE